MEKTTNLFIEMFLEKNNTFQKFKTLSRKTKYFSKNQNTFVEKQNTF